MTNQIQNPNDEGRQSSPLSGAQSDKKYDLDVRTLKFAEAITEFVQILPENPVTYVLKSQLIRSGTSIGANYHEADSAESRKDFFHKIGLCRKEGKETLYWLKLMMNAVPSQKAKCHKLLKEAQELTLIFSAIFKKSKTK